jgi:hypothetical protein
MKIVLLLIIALASFPAHAQLYKWTDANGKVHYSDRPLDGGNVKEIRVQSAATPAAGTGGDWRQQESDSRERRIRRDEANREAADAAARNTSGQPYNPSTNRSNKPMTDEEVCRRDAQQIAFSEKVPSLSFDRGVGGTVTVSEAERQAIVRQRKENHALLCGPGQRTR